MCIVHKGFRGIRAVSPSLNLGGNLIGLKPAPPYDTIHQPFSTSKKQPYDNKEFNQNNKKGMWSFPKNIFIQKKQFIQ